MPRLPSPTESEWNALHASGAKVRAAVCARAIEVTRRQVDPAAFAELVAGLPDASRSHLEKPPALDAWVPLVDWVPFVEALADTVGREQRLVLDLCRALAAADFTPASRLWAKLGSASANLGRVVRHWHELYDCGQLSVEQLHDVTDAVHLTVVLSQFPPWPTFTVVLQGMLEQVVAMTGGTNLLVTRTEVGTAPQAVRFDVVFRD